MVQVLIGAEVEEGVQRVGLQHIALVGLRIAGGQECTFRHQTRSRNAKYGTGGVSQNGKIGGLDFPPWQQVDIVLDFTIWSGSFTCGGSVELFEEVFFLTKQERLDGANFIIVSAMVTFSPSALSMVMGSTCGWRWAISLANHMPTK
ncbi:unnamed protein product [Sphagnum troendelagicum]|uniref:Uncharacterized protein n=1 Tax=Sphagnum troendelagicum TaxID=128251 RepID=A0ABP0UU41_9BRYO